MQSGPSQQVERELWHLLEQAQEDGATDRQLLERFVQQRDETAFAVLVRRHGGLVWSVCRSLVRDPHLAEDVYQATWLILAQKLRSVVWRDSIAGWLYEVAHRLALKARGRSVRETRRLAQLPGEPVAQEAVCSDEERGLLDAVASLPEKYRAPIVLCYLEGKTNAEAAQALNCPLGSMSKRLGRGLELLRERLRQRGTPEGQPLPACLTALVACGVPAAIDAVVVPSAVALGGGNATLSAIASKVVVTLVEGMVRDMTLRQFKFVGVIALLLLLGGAGLGVLSRYAAVAQPEGIKNPNEKGGLNPAEPGKQPAAPARQFSSSQLFTVHQIVEGQTHSRRLGSTQPMVFGQIGGAPRKPAAIQIPAGATWYVQYMPPINLGGVAFGGGGVGFGGGALGAGGGMNLGGGVAGGAGFQGNIGGLNLGGGFGGFQGMPIPKLTGKDLQNLTTELKKQNVPGLRLENVELSDEDLDSLVKDAPHLQTLLLYNTKTTDAGIRRLVGLKNLRVLGLEGSEFTDRGIAELARIRPLENLRLGGAKFTPQKFAAIEELRTLRTLRLTWTGLDGSALKSLTKLSNLENLEVIGETDDATLEVLQEAQTLRQVRLHFTRITGKGLAALAKLEKLEQLTLDWMWGEEGPVFQGGFGFFGGGAFFGAMGGIGPGAPGFPPPGAGQGPNLQLNVIPQTPTPDGGRKEKAAPGIAVADLRVLGQIKGLTSLYLMGKDFGDAEAERLKECVGLKKLELFAPNLTDAGVNHLKDLKALERLNLCFSKVTPACTGTLKGMPNLKVLFVPLIPPDPNYKRNLAQYQSALPRVSVQTLATLPGMELLLSLTGM